MLRLKDIAGYKLELSSVLEQHQLLARDIRSSRALLNALPMPVWLRGRRRPDHWVNNAYVAAVEAQSEARSPREADRTARSRDQRTVVEGAVARASLSGTASTSSPAASASRTTSSCCPSTASTARRGDRRHRLETVQGELERQIAAYDRTLDRVATAVAIFNRDQQLTFFNEAYCKLWQLDPELARRTRRRDGAILDRLREQGKLPPVVDYRGWKREILDCYQTGKRLRRRAGICTDGRMLHVIAERAPDGGVTYLFDDETESARAREPLQALIDVQRETLDSLKEGVAVFGTDGRLKLFNPAFASIWKIPARSLPSCRTSTKSSQLASRAARRSPHVDAASARPSRRSRRARAARRPDGARRPERHRLRAVPLPDGATLLTFADVTDAKRDERALLERNEALVAADRLKSQFISHVSYELRTPLTNIIGFSELLASPAHRRPQRQAARIPRRHQSSSKTLLAIIDDILDLATIDAGASS